MFRSFHVYWFIKKPQKNQILIGVCLVLIIDSQL